MIFIFLFAPPLPLTYLNFKMKLNTRLQKPLATPRSIYPLSTFARSILFQLKVKSGLNGVYLIKLRFLFCFNTRFYVFSVSTKDTECESFSLLEKGTPTFARKNSSGEIALKYEVSFENITQQVDMS